MKTIIISALILVSFSGFKPVEQPADRILGKWISSQGNLIVEVFRQSGVFKGKVIWFKQTDKNGNPVKLHTDENNPDVNLRNRQILGMEVLDGLTYNNDLNRWDHGKIYDVRSGRQYNSAAWLAGDGILKVKGFWHFEVLGETMTFKRI